MRLQAVTALGRSPAAGMARSRATAQTASPACSKREGALPEGLPTRLAGRTCAQAPAASGAPLRCAPGQLRGRAGGRCYTAARSPVPLRCRMSSGHQLACVWHTGLRKAGGGSPLAWLQRAAAGGGLGGGAAPTLEDLVAQPVGWLDALADEVLEAFQALLQAPSIALTRVWSRAIRHPRVRAGDFAAPRRGGPSALYSVRWKWLQQRLPQSAAASRHERSSVAWRHTRVQGQRLYIMNQGLLHPGQTPR